MIVLILILSVLYSSNIDAMAEQMVATENFIPFVTDATIRGNTEKTLIVLAAPSVNDEYYSSKFTAIVDFMTNFANIVNEKDEIVILVDAATLPYFQGKVSSKILVKANIEDIWMRDFSSVIPTKQVKFKYASSYISTSDARAIEKSFEKWLLRNEIHYYKKSDIILDGGNVVDNPSGTRVIITERILRDNPSFTKASMKSNLKQVLDIDQVAIIKEVLDDTTGHADGIAMWATNDRILLTKLEEPLRSEVINELEISFSNVEIIEVPDYSEYSTWRDFVSAKNVYVNSVVTDNYIYMPTFNSPHDTEMLKLFQSHTDKTVVPIPAENVCMLGGSVRCVSWQVKGTDKMKILQAAIQ